MWINDPIETDDIRPITILYGAFKRSDHRTVGGVVRFKNPLQIKYDEPPIPSNKGWCPE